MDATSRQRRVAALMRLAVATREKVDRATYVLYVEDSAHVPTDVLEAACRRLEHTAEWFPKVAELLEECRIVNARRNERRDEEKRRKQLPPPPISEEKKNEIWAKFRALLEGKGM